MLLSALLAMTLATAEPVAPIDLKTSCAHPGSWTFSVSRTDDALGREVFTIGLKSPTPAKPPLFDAFFLTSGADVHNVWVPIYEQNERSRLYASEWGRARYESEIGRTMPVASTFNEAEENKLLVACSEAMRTVNYAITCRSTDASLEGHFRFFTRPEAPRTDYTVKILVDRRKVFFGEAVAAATRWIEQAAGLPPCRVPESTDCPSDLVGNRRRIADLRLTSGETAVHADMLVWSRDDTVEDAARVILNAIFGVVQYSIKLTDWPEEHRRLIRRWVDFANAHRSSLLKGVFRPHHPELMYPWIESSDDQERIVAVYGPDTVIPVAACKTTHLLNATKSAEVTVDLKDAATVTTCDVFGRKIATATVPKGLQRLACPVSGALEFAFPDDGTRAIARTVGAAVAENRALQEKLTDRCALTDYRSLVRAVGGTNVWTAAFQKALDEHEIVVVPPSAEPYQIDSALIVPSNRRIEATGATVRLMDGTQTVLLRNAHVVDGTLRPIPDGTRDANIAIVGGRWEDWHRQRLGYGRSSMIDPANYGLGHFKGASALLFFDNCDHVSLVDVTIAHSSGFAVQAGDGDAYRFERIQFDCCYADGLHLNGNLSRVLCRDIRGQVGDDLVALNAYDWLNSSVCFGPQRDIFCENLELVRIAGRGVYPAIRVQPAKFRYADGSVVDCAISNIVLRHVRGVMAFKGYFQTPGYVIGCDPEWGEVGSGGNWHYEDVDIGLLGPIDCIGQYKTSEAPRGHFGAFEFGANLSGVHLKGIRVQFQADKYPLSHLVSVGPKSSLVTNGRGERREVFDPYISNTVTDLTLEDIRATGVVPKDLVHLVEFSDINRDGKSTGRGTLKRVSPAR